VYYQDFVFSISCAVGPEINPPRFLIYHFVTAISDLFSRLFPPRCFSKYDIKIAFAETNAAPILEERDEAVVGCRTSRVDLEILRTPLPCNRQQLHCLAGISRLSFKEQYRVGRAQIADDQYIIITILARVQLAAS